MQTKETRAPVPYKLPLTDGRFARILANGAIASNQILVFMSSDVYELIRTQSRENDPREVGGVLLGQYCIDGSTRFAIVLAAIPCEFGSATPVSINFPPEFWQHVEEVHSATYPGLLRLGPYHSHPGYGVCPSSIDHTTILRAFSHPHHISVIYDPHTDEIGCTCWQDDNLMPPSGCFIYEHREPDSVIQELMEARVEEGQG